MKIALFNMNIVVDYETMAEGLKKALSAKNLQELRAVLIMLADYCDGALYSKKEKEKCQYQDITTSTETNRI